MKKITAAIVIIDKNGSILGCHGTGKPKDKGFDFPKGIVDEGETDFEAALRELGEETSIKIEDKENIIDCGVHHHNKEKDIHIFLYKVTDFPNIDELNCKSMFETKDGKLLPEVDFYEIISLKDRYKFNFVLQNKFEIIDKYNND